MTPRIVQIRRHPIKGIGTELLDNAILHADRPLMGDRAWAVLRDGRQDTGSWQPRANFAQCASGPGLMPITIKSGTSHFLICHPQRPDLLLKPETDGPALVQWLQPIWPQDSPAPTQLIRAPTMGMTDADYASVSVMNHASLRALSQRAGIPLDPRRFRGNLWVDGLAPWEELDLVGKSMRIGDAVLEIVEPLERCRAVDASPETGDRDLNLLAALNAGWGHQDFGVATRVLEGGQVRVGDQLELS